MAGTFTYLYDPQQHVWVIDSIDTSNDPVPAVRAGMIVRVRAEALMSGTTLYYDVSVTGESGTTAFVEDDVFSTLTDATAEYELRLAA